MHFRVHWDNNGIDPWFTKVTCDSKKTNILRCNTNPPNPNELGCSKLYLHCGNDCFNAHVHVYWYQLLSERALAQHSYAKGPRNTIIDSGLFWHNIFAVLSRTSKIIVYFQRPLYCKCM